MRLTTRSLNLLRSGRGQSLTEFALVFPMFLLVVLSLVIVGLWIFYSQQLANAAREGARYAAVHSTSSQCPTVSRLDPTGPNQATGYYRCDAPEAGWPRMTARARSFVWGLDATAVSIAACWSGYVTPASQADALPQSPNTFRDCTIGTVSPSTNAGALACPAAATIAGSTTSKADGDDKASSLAYANGTHYPTTVTVYACMTWRPPLAGFLLVPSTIVIRQVATETMQRQQ